MTTLDKRLHVFRPDLADVALQGRVEAARFVDGRTAQLVWPVTSVRRAPQNEAMQISQALYGETCKVFENANGWAWVQLDGDGYVGYVLAAGLGKREADATHKVVVPTAHIYPKADLKTQPALSIPMNALLAVSSDTDDYLALQGSGFVFAKHVARINHHENDFVAVAEKFLHVPYLWGGKTMQGIDCSGLVQVSLQACGIKARRDSDMQENELGTARNPQDFSNLQRGDLVFWKGHVGIMQDEKQLLHANGHHMLTVSEPLATAAARIAAKGSPVTVIKRL